MAKFKVGDKFQLADCKCRSCSLLRNKAKTEFTVRKVTSFRNTNIFYSEELLPGHYFYPYEIKPISSKETISESNLSTQWF